jgi:VanZ family protein
MAHIYGTKNFYTVIIRATAAYRMPDSFELYCLCWLTFFGVFVLYSTEFLVYRTVRPKEAAIPLITSSLGMIWMWMEKDFYCD